MSKTADNERKFLLETFPSDEYLSKAYMIRTGRQGFLKKDSDNEIKVNGYPEVDEYFVTQKTRDELGKRTKNKEPISKEAFNILFSLTEGARIHKSAFAIAEGGFELRFDDFIDPTTQGKIKMLELTEPEGTKYEFPDEPWVRGMKEVTDDPAFLNQNLAM